MPTASAKPTTAANLEAKFDAGDDVLDFFDIDSAKVVLPAGKAAPKSRRNSIDELKRAIKLTKEIEKLERLKAGGDHWQHEPDGDSWLGVMPRYGKVSEMRWFKGPKGVSAFHFVNAFDDPVLKGAEFWCEDRLHLNPYGHARVAHLVLSALGVPSAAEPGPTPKPWHSGALAEARYYRDHVAPWVGRRIRKRSSGDNRSYKYAEWTEVEAS